MANRDFRKNLALLCALAGGATALSSINVPTSAMEDDKLDLDEKNINYLVDDFKKQYNTKRKETLEQLLERYNKWTDPITAYTLAISVKMNLIKERTLSNLTDSEEHYTAEGETKRAELVRKLKLRLESDQGIKWKAPFHNLNLTKNDVSVPTAPITNQKENENKITITIIKPDTQDYVPKYIDKKELTKTYEKKARDNYAKAGKEFDIINQKNKILVDDFREKYNKTYTSLSGATAFEKALGEYQGLICTDAAKALLFAARYQLTQEKTIRSLTRIESELTLAKKHEDADQIALLINDLRGKNRINWVKK